MDTQTLIRYSPAHRGTISSWSTPSLIKHFPWAVATTCFVLSYFLASMLGTFQYLN